MNKLYNDVISFKRAIEATDPQERPIGLEAFSQGACSDVAFMLGSYLTRKGYGQFSVICGERGSAIDNTWTTHAWLEQNKLIVDITCSQFEEVTDEVIVSETSEWHSTFVDRSTEIADVYARDQGASVALVPFYERLIQALDCT